MEPVYETHLSSLKNKNVAVIGYGSQGRGQALNLHDSGVDVTIGLREGSPSHLRAGRDGLKTTSIDDAVRHADVVAVLIPDTAQPQVFAGHIKQNLKPSACLLFSHGFNVRYGCIQLPEGCDVVMVAPKGPGNLVRETYESGKGVPCLVAVEQDATNNAESLALGYAAGVGGARAGVIRTTFKEETETDLFGEQAVLCGGATALVKAGFETLVDAGYQPEVAYFECLHELKLIVDLLQRAGLKGMRDAISDTARYGDVSRGPVIVDAHVRKKMQDVLEQIQDGRFAKEWIAECESGAERFNKLVEDDAHHPLERVGKKLRAAMPWLEGATA
ncbi:MAG: ketol-acid reductoisomerase [Planctomycetota bacterium]